jgi:hypothetical protein
VPLQSRGLGRNLLLQLQNFIGNNNFQRLYRAYDWGNDTYENEFPDILALEVRLSENDRTIGITLDDVRAVANWGRLRNPGRIQGLQIVCKPNTFNSLVGGPQQQLINNPELLINAVANVQGLGPTYQSKVLRFAQAQEYGAIDTRCVRVFGLGDPGSQQLEWLHLSAKQSSYKGRPSGWSIPEKQAGWPSQYAVWINILRYFANQLPNNCPHPASFVSAGIRAEGKWTCADVEMALFTFASKHT